MLYCSVHAIGRHLWIFPSLFYLWCSTFLSICLSLCILYHSVCHLYSVQLCTCLSISPHFSLSISFPAYLSYFLALCLSLSTPVSFPSFCSNVSLPFSLFPSSQSICLPSLYLCISLSDVPCRPSPWKNASRPLPV